VGRGPDERRGMSRFILLDHEAVQALADPAHPKHRRVRNRTRVSVADAHLGAAIRAADQVTVLTSDPLDMHVVAEGKHIEVVTC
jgi:hypothetical protein